MYIYLFLSKWGAGSDGMRCMCSLMKLSSDISVAINLQDKPKYDKIKIKVCVKNDR